MPVLNRIPVGAIREELIEHTRRQYESVSNLKSGNLENDIVNRRPPNITQDELSGADLLRAYRNVHHGYNLRDQREKANIYRHSGTIPNDLPDVAFALWHYILLEFPFR